MTNLIVKKLQPKEKLLFTAIFIFLVCLRIWFITGVPKYYINGLHDDLFFAKAAHYIAHGEWMGPYTQMTLIKTPFYAFFLVFSSFTGLPLLLNETLFYILACLVLYVALFPLIQKQSWRLLLFTLILFSPANLLYLRIYRESVYFSLTLFVISFSIGLFLRLDRRISNILLWVIGLGLSMGAFLITREEGVWIYPILFTFLFICLLFVWTGKADKKFGRSFLLILPIILWYIPSIIVSSINYSYYDFWGTTEQLEPDFSRVLHTLGRIKSDTWHPLVRVSRDKRRKAYEASPIFNQLREPIESLMPIWNMSEDQMVDNKPDWYLARYGIDRRELSNDYFGWLLRDAVYNAGYYAEGKYPNDFYRRLADQLEAACDNGTLECSSAQRIPLVGSIDQRHYPIIARMFIENIFHLLKQDYTGIGSLDLRTWSKWPGNSEDHKYFEEIAHNPLADLEIPYGKDTQYLIDGKLDSRVQILQVKESAMKAVYRVYDFVTPLLFVTGMIAWVYLFVGVKREGIRDTYLVLSFFAMGLFISRLMMLTIVDATTGAPGIMYGNSIYLFLYIFSFLMLFWGIQRLKMILDRKKQTSLPSTMEGK